MRTIICPRPFQRCAEPIATQHQAEATVPPTVLDTQPVNDGAGVPSVLSVLRRPGSIESNTSARAWSLQNDDPSQDGQQAAAPRQPFPAQGPSASRGWEVCD